MKSPSPILIAAVVVIGATGFFIGRISSSAPAGDSIPGAATASGRSASRGGGSSLADGRRSSRASRTDNRRDASPDRVSGTEALARLESIVRRENALDRNRALLAFIDQLDPAEFEGAVAHFRSLGITEDRFGVYAMLLTAWAQTDPTKAQDYVRANTRGGFALNTVLSSWASKDPESAIAWAQATHTGTGANPFMAGIIRAVAATDTGRASELLTAMPRSRERGEALDGFLAHLTQAGPEAARQWVDALGDPALRDGSMSRLAEKLAQTDPAGTARWLLANPGEALNGRLDNVVGTWASTDQRAAVDFFKTLPQGDTRNNAFRGIISAVASKDPQSAATMIDRYSADADNGAIRSFVWHSFGQEPALALDYVSRMTDAGDQERTYQRTLGHWLDKDPTQAQAWIQNNNLPPKVLESLQRDQGQQRQQ
ncbi:MAG: hypothetical protein K9M97_03545 [Akkermansiaceae bacterium]|nr:hypothetical protein [Akkermansiaceae bacterium]